MANNRGRGESGCGSKRTLVVRTLVPHEQLVVLDVAPPPRSAIWFRRALAKIRRRPMTLVPIPAHRLIMSAAIPADTAPAIFTKCRGTIFATRAAATGTCRSPSAVAGEGD